MVQGDGRYNLVESYKVAIIDFTYWRHALDDEFCWLCREVNEGIGLNKLMVVKSIKFVPPEVLNSTKCGCKSKIESLFFFIIKELTSC